MGKPLTITKRELAKLLGTNFKVSWVEDQCRRRQIPHLLIAGQYAFTEQHVQEILTMHERRPIGDSTPAVPVTSPQPQAAAPPRPARVPRTPLPVPAGIPPLRDRSVPTHRLRDAS